MDCIFTSSHERCNDCVARLEGKHGSKITFCTKAVRTPKKLRQEFQIVDVETGFIDDNAIDGHTWMFIKVWKDLCEKEENAYEIVGKMIDIYYPRIRPKRKTELLNQMTASYPHLGLVNVAIASIKFGLWDRMSSSSQDVNTDIEPSEENTLVADKHVLEGFIDDNAIDEHTWRFIKIWKDLSEKQENVVQVLDEMLDFYHPQMDPGRKRKVLNKTTISYPHAGFLNVAIASIKFGLWDRMISPLANSNKVEILETSTSLNHEGQGGTNAVDLVSVEDDLVDQDGSLGFSPKDQLLHGPVNAKQASVTGRRGEEVAFKYYQNMGIKVVKWVNEASETGLPYDIEVCDDENRKEYVEVKTTSSKTKDWFEISGREWQFAVKKGESFSIARVVLLGSKRARVTVFKDPARLCRLGQLKLAVLMLEKQNDDFVLC